MTISARKRLWLLCLKQDHPLRGSFKEQRPLISSTISQTRRNLAVNAVKVNTDLTLNW